MRRIIIAITGASGAIYGVRALELLRAEPDVQTHLVVSRPGALTIAQECGLSLKQVEALADVTYKHSAVGARIASGSFAIAAMLIMPCSIRTLSAIAFAHADDLIARAADVTLKEGRPLLLMVREAPLHVGHLRAMTAAAESGAIIMPPAPAFYLHPESIDDIVDHTVRRSLARVGIDLADSEEWAGFPETPLPSADDDRPPSP